MQFNKYQLQALAFCVLWQALHNTSLNSETAFLIFPCQMKTSYKTELLTTTSLKKEEEEKKETYLDLLLMLQNLKINLGNCFDYLTVNNL